MIPSGSIKRLNGIWMSSSNQKKKQFERLYQSHSDKIYRLCLGYLRDEFEVKDLFQQVMLNIWNNIDSFRGESKISTWVYRITVNTAITYSKNRQKLDQRFKLERDFADVEYSQTGKPSLDPVPQFRELHDCIHNLEKQNRLIITLYLEGLSYKKIGEVVGISENYVGVKINRIKKKLEKLMRSTNEFE